MALTTPAIDNELIRWNSSSCQQSFDPSFSGCINLYKTNLPLSPSHSHYSHSHYSHHLTSTFATFAVENSTTMEFIEFESFQDDQIPQPQPALSIPLPSNIENLSKKIPKFNKFKNLLNFEDQPSVEETDEIALKYAKLSLDLIKSNDPVPSGLEGGYSLSTKLSKVLNNNVDDNLFSQVFSTDLNEHQLIDSSITGSLSRKQIRGKFEENLVKNQLSLLKDFSPIIKQFKQVGEMLDSLNRLNLANDERINEIFENVKVFDEEFKSLNSEKNTINLKKHLLTTFKNKFLLNEFEEFTISNNEITRDFFTTISKLDTINENLSILLSIENSNLGINIMKKTSSLIDKSNETLYNFIKRSLIHPVWVNSPEKLTNFRNSIKFLKQRNPQSFDQVLTIFANERSKLLIEDFNKQLTAITAHDPVRFIGDLLAYVHSMVINEIELMNSIFKITLHETLEFIDENDIPVFNGFVDLLLDRVFEKLSKSIKSKFEQLISIELKLNTVYSVFNLFDLYKLMFEKNFSESNSLVKSINELIEFSQLRVIDLIDSSLKSIKTSNLAQLDLNDDLQPPEWIIEFYSDILPIVEQSKVTFNSVLNLNGEQFDEFMTLIVNEPISILDSHIKLKHFGSLEKVILKINFIDLILSKILPITLFNDKVIELNDEIDSLKQQVENIQYDDLLKNCKLYDFQNVINMIVPFEDEFFDLSIYDPIKENKHFDKSHIDQINSSISEYLPNALIELQSALLKITNPLTSNEIVELCCLKFVKFCLKFDIITTEFLDKKLIWSDMEISTLLGVEDIYRVQKQNISLE